MLLAYHKKSYLICDEITNFEILLIKQAFPRNAWWPGNSAGMSTSTTWYTTTTTTHLTGAAWADHMCLKYIMYLCKVHSLYESLLAAFIPAKGRLPGYRYASLTNYVIFIYFQAAVSALFLVVSVLYFEKKLGVGCVNIQKFVISSHIK